MENHYWNLYDLKVDYKELSYSHGIEIEYFLLDQNYSPISNQDKFISLVSKSGQDLKRKITENPKISGKIEKMDFCDEKDLLRRRDNKSFKKSFTFTVYYKRNLCESSSTYFDIISKDTHLGTGNSLTIEIVTPPCQTLDELRWWLKNIHKCIYKACRDIGVHFLPIGSHPELPLNFTGEHHHLGICKKSMRVKIYNVLRLFLPILIQWNFNSFNKKQVESFNFHSDFLKSEFSSFNRCIRLKKTQQIKPVPPLSLKSSISELSQKTQIDKESIRMLELYPFTDYGTLEIRCFDTQLSLSRSLATVILLQTVANFAHNISNSEIESLNKLMTYKLYKTYRKLYLEKGLSQRVNTAKLNRRRKNDLKQICKICKNKSKCNPNQNFPRKKDFCAESPHIDSIVKMLFFPSIYEFKHLSKTNNIPTGKLQLKILLDILYPTLKNNGFQNHPVLKVLFKTIKLNLEPSTWIIHQYKKANNLEEFGKSLNTHQRKALLSETPWACYLDPFLELSKLKE